jgi:hypothetical protein
MPRKVERWKSVFDHPKYEVSNFGRIRSLKRKEPRIMVLCPSTGGYPSVTLDAKCYTVHRLVALHFLGPRPEGMTINHKNLDKCDNRVANLEYISFGENHRLATQAGRMTRGTKHHFNKLSERQVREIRYLLKRQFTVSTIARMYSVARNTILTIRSGKSWSHVKGHAVRPTF